MAGSSPSFISSIVALGPRGRDGPTFNSTTVIPPAIFQKSTPPTASERERELETAAPRSHEPSLASLASLACRLSLLSLASGGSGRSFASLWSGSLVLGRLSFFLTLAPFALNAGLA